MNRIPPLLIAAVCVGEACGAHCRSARRDHSCTASSGRGCGHAYVTQRSANAATAAAAGAAEQSDQVARGLESSNPECRRPEESSLANRERNGDCQTHHYQQR